MLKGYMVMHDSQGNEIEEVSLLKAPFREKLIKEISVEMFNEEEPCIIYRTVCINKLGLKLLDKLNNLKIEKDNIFKVNDIIVQDIDFVDEVFYVSFR